MFLTAPVAAGPASTAEFVATATAARAMRNAYAMVALPGKNLAELVTNRIPTFLVRFCLLIIRKAGMQEREESAFSVFLEGHRNDCFFSQRVARHPGKLNSTWSIDFRKPPIVGGASYGEPVPEPVDLWIDDQLFMLVPRT